MDTVLHAIADRTRRQILDLLSENRLMTAGEIAESFPHMSRPAVSQHLAVLRDAHLIQVERQGRYQVYKLDVEPLRELWELWLSNYEYLWSRKLSDLKRVVEADVFSQTDGREDEE